MMEYTIVSLLLVACTTLADNSTFGTYWLTSDVEQSSLLNLDPYKVVNGEFTIFLWYIDLVFTTRFDVNIEEDVGFPFELTDWKTEKTFLTS